LIEPYKLQFSYAKAPKRIPQVISSEEAKLIISYLSGYHYLIDAILFGSGLRLKGALKLRIKDIDLSTKSIFVYQTHTPSSWILLFTNKNSSG